MLKCTGKKAVQRFEEQAGMSGGYHFQRYASSVPPTMVGTHPIGADARGEDGERDGTLEVEHRPRQGKYMENARTGRAEAVRALADSRIFAVSIRVGSETPRETDELT